VPPSGKGGGTTPHFCAQPSVTIEPMETFDEDQQ
jgi:hypothetical protein